MWSQMFLFSRVWFLFLWIKNSSQLFWGWFADCYSFYGRSGYELVQPEVAFNIAVLSLGSLFADEPLCCDVEHGHELVVGQDKLGESFGIGCNFVLIVEEEDAFVGEQGLTLRHGQVVG